MKTGKLFMMIVLLATAGLPLYAQQGLLKLNLQYSAAIPSGSFHQFISHASFRGFDASLLYGINDKLSLGFNTGFQDFYQKYPRQVYKTTDGSDISAVVSNSVQTVPLMAKATYKLVTGKKLQPYAGLAAGGNMALYRQYLGEFSTGDKNKFSFQAQPEIGVYIPFSKESESGVTISGVYNFIAFHYNGLDNLNHFGIRVGVSFPTRN